MDIALTHGNGAVDDLMKCGLNFIGLHKTRIWYRAPANIGTYLRNIAGEPPVDMIDPHAHHILFKTGNGDTQKELVKIGQDILRKYGIDPVVGAENLVWAPNRIAGQHDINALEDVVSGLIEISESGGDYDEIVRWLSLMGQIASER